MTYTALCAVALGYTVLLDLVLLGTRLLLRRIFWVSYAIVLGFQLLTNAWLTGRGIVTYADPAILGLRLAYAPVEDLAFGFALIVQSLAWWVWWGRRASRPRAGGPSRGGPAAPGARPGGPPPPGEGSTR